jgi:Ca2+-binding EF-hand superfamily protein
MSNNEETIAMNNKMAKK